MGFGSAFTSAWNKASNAVQQKVSQVATTAHKVANKAIEKAEQVAQKAATQAQAADKFIAAQKAKATNAVKQTAQKALAVVKKPVAQAVEKAKQNIVKAASNAQQAAAKVAATVEQKAISPAKKVKSNFKKLKKDFRPTQLVKRVVQTCPLIQKPLKTWQSSSSLASKSASSLSFGITKWKEAGKLKKAATLLYKMGKAGGVAAHGARGAAMGKAFLQFGTAISKKSIALGIGIKGLTGGLDSFARNVDRKDISNANKAGRVAFGAVKGLTKGILAAGSGALVGAAIGATLGLVLGPPGAIAGASAGAKLGATLLSPMFDKAAERWTEKLFPASSEDKWGKAGDQTAKKVTSGVKSSLNGAVNLFRPPKLAF